MASIEDYNSQIIEFLKVLTDQTRLNIIHLLRKGEKTSKEIQDFVQKSQPRVSQHLKQLLSANIIEYRQDGVQKYYYIKDNKIFEMLGEVVKFVFKSNKIQEKNMQSVDLMDLLM